MHVFKIATNSRFFPYVAIIKSEDPISFNKSCFNEEPISFKYIGHIVEQNIDSKVISRINSNGSYILSKKPVIFSVAYDLYNPKGLIRSFSHLIVVEDSSLSTIHDALKHIAAGDSLLVSSINFIDLVDYIDLPD